MDEREIRAVVLATAKTLIGLNKADGSYMTIIDGYNAHRPLPRGYKLQPDDPWCAGTISYIGYCTGFDDIIHPECGVANMIALYGTRVKGRDYTPTPGDIVTFDWDRHGYPDHVGLVYKVEGGVITTIEGNYGGCVRSRTFPVGWKWVYKYCLPDYRSKSNKAEPKKHWAADAMAWAKDKGYMDGTRPDAPLTRGEAATILRRMKEGE